MWLPALTDAVALLLRGRPNALGRGAQRRL